MLAAAATPPGDKSTTAPPAAADAGQTVEAPAADAGQDKSTLKNQAIWSEKFKTLNSQFERDVVFSEAIQRRASTSCRRSLVNNDVGQRPAIGTEDRNRALGELARLQKSIVADRKAIADFEEEARRAGVPPGWLRGFAARRAPACSSKSAIAFRSATMHF